MAQPDLEVSRKALANPHGSPVYQALLTARAHLADAQQWLNCAEAAWLALIKPARDEQGQKSGRCQCSRDGEVCDFSGCPQTRDNEPATSGRSCPLPHGCDEL